MTRPRGPGARKGTEAGAGRKAPRPWGTIRLPPGAALVVAVDTLVAGVHFPLDTAPAAVGHKALAVNLSDLAAMGAGPLAYSVALSLPAPARRSSGGAVAAGDTAPRGSEGLPPGVSSARWLEEFRGGLQGLADRYGVRQVAEHRVEGPVRVTVEVYGQVSADAAILRRGAQAGDDVYVSGTVGDAAFALEVLSGRHPHAPAVLARVRDRLDRPEPRVALGLALRGLASAAIDVSDGLAADLGHVLAASGVGAEIEAARLPLSETLRAALDPVSGWRLALGGGDDYELLFTAPAGRGDEVARAAREAGVPVTRIGRIVVTPGLACHGPDGAPLAVPHGYEHFKPGPASPRRE